MRTTPPATPLLWISGAPGTGKTTTGWRVFELLTDAGGNAAYVDIDQLGLLGPFDRLTGTAPHVVKAENAHRLIDALRASGLRQMIISGIVDPDVGAPRFGSADASSAIDLTHLRLRCDWPELRRRYLDRGSPHETLDDLEEVARQYDRSAADTVDTTGLGVDELARSLIAQHCAASPSTWTPQTRADAARLPTTVLYGATAVGKSTVGWELVRRRWAAGLATAYIDVEQLGFHGPGYDRTVHTAAYAALTRGYQDAGAEDLIVVTRDPELVLDVHLDRVTTVLLDASPDALGTRIGLRSGKSTGRLPDDEILGADPARRRLLTARAHREAERFRRNGAPTVMVDTTDILPTDVVERIERNTARRG